MLDPLIYPRESHLYTNKESLFEYQLEMGLPKVYKGVEERGDLSLKQDISWRGANTCDYIWRGGNNRDYEIFNLLPLLPVMTYSRLR